MASYKQCSDSAQKGPGVNRGAGSAAPSNKSAPSTGGSSFGVSPNASKRGKDSKSK